MLDLAASDMHLVTQRPVSHVKVQDAAEVQSKFYKFGQLLGRGAYGTVMLGTERTTGDKWAIKILNKAQCGATQLSLFQREIRILAAVRHPHIIHLERVLESPSALFLVLELCVGELADIAKKRPVFSENEVRRVLQCLASAVTYLHSKDIVHRDLKLENILVAANPHDSNDKLYVKVTDFGLSVVRGGVGQENMLQEMCGTPAYMAPELFGARMYSQQCDIWAMGVIMYILLTGKFPFEQRSSKPLPLVVATEEPDFSHSSFKGEEKEPLKKLLRKMLEKNPAYRANARDVEMDPWTRNAAEEAPAENAMELMRMWRKDLRTPSLSIPGGSFSGPSGADHGSVRRTSRLSGITETIRADGGGGGASGNTARDGGATGARRKGKQANFADEAGVKRGQRAAYGDPTHEKNHGVSSPPSRDTNRLKKLPHPPSSPVSAAVPLTPPSLTNTKKMNLVHTKKPLKATKAISDQKFSPKETKPPHLFQSPPRAGKKIENSKATSQKPRTPDSDITRYKRPQKTVKVIHRQPVYQDKWETSEPNLMVANDDVRQARPVNAGFQNLRGFPPVQEAIYEHLQDLRERRRSSMTNREIPYYEEVQGGCTHMRRILRRGVVVRDESHRLHMEDYGSTMNLMNPAFAPRVVYIQPERTTGMNTVSTGGIMSESPLITSSAPPASTTSTGLTSENTSGVVRSRTEGISEMLKYSGRAKNNFWINSRGRNPRESGSPMPSQITLSARSSPGSLNLLNSHPNSQP